MATQTMFPEQRPDYIDDSRFERFHGQWIERPVPKTTHAQVQSNVLSALQNPVRALGGRILPEWSVDSPDRAQQAIPDYLTPDVTVALPPVNVTERDYVESRSTFLVVEVKSPGQTGLFQKAQNYASWGIPHVWIIDPDSKECFEYHGGNQFVFTHDKLTAGPLSVPLAEVFEGTTPQSGI